MEKHVAVYNVTIICRRKRIIDPDNLCVKFAIDAIKGPGRLLEDDSPAVIRTLNIQQEKSKEPETVIILERVDPPMNTGD